MILTQWQTELLLQFQGINALWEKVMLFSTWLGYPFILLWITATIFWCVDARTGYRFAFFILFGGVINEALKLVFHLPRPYWTDPRIASIGHASSSFGFPSGHAQISAVWMYIGSLLRSRSGWALAILTALLVGISRVFLGQHFPLQVLWGWIIGFVLYLVFIRLEQPLKNWFVKHNLIQKLAYLGVAAILLCAVNWSIAQRLSGWHMPENWASNAQIYHDADEDLNPADPGSGYALIMALIGALFGMMLQNQQGGYSAKGRLRKRLARWLVGTMAIVLLMGAFTFIEKIVPLEDGSAGMIIWDSLQSFIILFCIFHPLPAMFRRLRLLL
ncbi:MAG: hypothetical protein B6D68_03565 [spirochete symbiont of Stewartia floridana]|nr:MAG: hypothetical protein B6D68_03565 [spirochete symbiont of Stewartia floridana]